MNSTHDSAVEQWLTWAFSPTISAIIVTLLVGTLLPIAIHIYLYNSSKSSSSIPTFLLAGPSGSGKTSLLTLLANAAPTPTHTSQTTTTATCRLPDTTRTSADKYRSENDNATPDQPQFNVLDTPGHGKLRHHALSTLTSTTSAAPKGIIYVVDSAAPSLTEAAAYLHEILLELQKRVTRNKTSKIPQPVSVLIAANKQDVFTALPPALVKSRLEEEIAKIRRTKSRGLLDSAVGGADEAGDDEESEWLGEYGTDGFSFAQMEEYAVEVDVLGGNVRGEEEGVDAAAGAKVEQWWSWIGEHI